MNTSQGEAGQRVRPMGVTKIVHLGIEDREARGRKAGEQVPPSCHAGWRLAAGRPDPVALLEEQNRTREPDLVPVRHGRMMISPFTFYRGAATIMAADLAGTPVAGLSAQLCGDAHLSNFGAFASPERALVFDVNDFDETLPGPFEYDVKRMAASFTIAARNNGFAEPDARAATLASVASYRQAMASFAHMRTMDIWYARLAEDQVLHTGHAAVAEISKQAKAAKKEPKTVREAAEQKKKEAKRAEKAAAKAAAKARTRDSLQALSKLGELVDGRYRIVSQPPIVVPARDLAATYGIPPGDIDQLVRQQFQAYRASLREDQRRLLGRFQIVDMAPQGRRCGQRRHSGVHRLAPGARRA